MQPLPLSPAGTQLRNDLVAGGQPKPNSTQETLHVAGVGDRLFFAYEQLRNAAEYSEQHLLLRRSIERFLRRTNSVTDQSTPKIAHDLVTELTQARYLDNDSVSHSVLTDIDRLYGEYGRQARQLLSDGISKQLIANWIYETASVDIERVLIDQRATDIFIDFAYGHFLSSIERESVALEADEAVYRIALYCAVHRSLLKSDIATVRYYLTSANGGISQDTDSFVRINQSVDRLYQQKLTNRLLRLIQRNGAPLRVIRELIIHTSKPQELIENRSNMLARSKSVANEQYRLSRKRLRDGIIRSVAFIFITKMLIGLAVEVPYDLYVYGSIAWLPLALNLLIPPLYMATIGWGIQVPGTRNTNAIATTIDRIIYQTEHPPLWYKASSATNGGTANAIFNGIYILTFAISFGALVYLLGRLQFNLINGAIFFIFLSAVSFFGFRLLQTAKEFQMIEERQTIIGTLADFFYTPFIRAGHWLSDKYSRLNVITLILDYAIELPLKSSLRFTRQWVGFLRDKREQL